MPHKDESSTSLDDEIGLEQLDSRYAAFVTTLSGSIPSFSTVTPYMLDMCHYLWPSFSWIAYRRASKTPLGYVIGLPNIAERFLFIWQLAVPPASRTPLPATIELIRQIVKVAKQHNFEELRYTVRKTRAHENHVNRLFFDLQMDVPERLDASPFSPNRPKQKESLFRIKL